MPGIEFHQVSKAYGRQTALQPLQLTIREGEYLVLVGPSGSGKTTLLRLIAGLEQPDRGRLTIAGRDQHQVDPADRGVALVFQGHALYPHLTARENLALPLRLRKVSAREIAIRVAETARSLGIDSLLDRLPEHLSGGERQRVALGRAVIGRPQILLLDEPLSDLDPGLRSQLRGELRRLASAHRLTVVHVTHDPREAMSLGDRLAVLRQGCLEQCDTPAELYQKPASKFIARFLGDPPMNLWRLPDGSWQGVRPEHLQWTPTSSGAPLVSGTVARLDFTGRDTWLMLDHPDGEIACPAPRDTDPPPLGTVVPLFAAPAHRHHFPPDSGIPAVF